MKPDEIKEKLIEQFKAIHETILNRLSNGSILDMGGIKSLVDAEAKILDTLGNL